MNVATTATVWSSFERQLSQSLTTRVRTAAVHTWQRMYPTIEGLDMDALVFHARKGDRRPELIRILLELHQRGDSTATTVLLLAQLPMLGAISRTAYLTGPSADAEERMQTTLMVFTELAQSVDCATSRLVEVLYFQTLEYVRDRRKRLQELPTEDNEFLEWHIHKNGSTNQPAEETSCVDDQLMIAARNGRPLRDRDAEILRAMYQREDPVTVKELAKELGLSENAAESRLRRAADRLRQSAAGARADVAATAA